MTATLQGVGVGLRPPHIQAVLRDSPDIAWFEVHICNFLGQGLNRALLERVSAQYPLSYHGVNMNLGGVDPLDTGYLRQLREVIDALNPALVSEHACFTALNGEHYHDLLPIPYTDAALENMVERVDKVQTALGRQMLVENVSRYSTYTESTYSEAEFLRVLVQRTGCGLVLDVNNAYVNQHDLTKPAAESSAEPVDSFIASLPLDAVGEIHLAGHTKVDGQLVDTHAGPVGDAVWQLYAQLLQDYPSMRDVPCLIEWDNQLPDFPGLMAEANKAEAIRYGEC